MNKLVTLLLAALVLAACGNAAEEIAERAIEAGADGDVDVEFDLDDEGQGEFVIETEDGTQTVDLGASELPAELDVPFPGGYEVVASSVLESSGETFVTALVNYPGGDIDEIVAHFESYYAGIEGASMTETSIEGARQILWFTQDPARNVSVIQRDGEDWVEVSVTQEG